MGKVHLKKSLPRRVQNLCAEGKNRLGGTSLSASLPNPLVCASHASLIVWFLNHVCTKCQLVDISFMWFSLSSSSHGEDAAEVHTPVRQQSQPVKAKDGDEHHIAAPSAQPSAPAVKKEPKEPEGPRVESAPSVEVPPQEAGEHVTLALEPLQPSKPKPEPELRPERDLHPSGKPQQEGADEEKPADAVPGGHEHFINNKDPVCEAEKQLWAAVEETTTEIGVEKGMESSESKKAKEEKLKEEEGVIGG